MKKAKIVSLGLVIGVIFLLIGCASTSASSSQTLSQKYSERLDQTRLGMSLEEFKQIWPEAKFLSSDRLSNTETWRFSEQYIPFVSSFTGKGMASISFYFQGNILTNFGETNIGSAF